MWIIRDWTFFLFPCIGLPHEYIYFKTIFAYSIYIIVYNQTGLSSLSLFVCLCVSHSFLYAVVFLQPPPSPTKTSFLTSDSFTNFTSRRGGIYPLPQCVQMPHWLFKLHYTFAIQMSYLARVIYSSWRCHLIIAVALIVCQVKKFSFYTVLNIYQVDIVVYPFLIYLWTLFFGQQWLIYTVCLARVLYNAHKTFKS